MFQDLGAALAAAMGGMVGAFSPKRHYVSRQGFAGRNARRLKRRAHHAAKMANVRRARANGR